MKAVAFIPRKPNSSHLREVPKPSLGGIEGGRTVAINRHDGTGMRDGDGGFYYDHQGGPD